MKTETWLTFCVLLCCVCCFVKASVVVSEERRENKAQLVKKYLKKLKKEDGAIKLVGGSNELEGIACIFIPYIFFSQDINSIKYNIIVIFKYII